MEDFATIRSSVEQTLIKNGAISILKAQLRASIINALEDDEVDVLATKKSDLEEEMLSIVKDFLTGFGMKNTLSVIDHEWVTAKQSGKKLLLEVALSRPKLSDQPKSPSKESLRKSASHSLTDLNHMSPPSLQTLKHSIPSIPAYRPSSPLSMAQKSEVVSPPLSPRGHPAKSLSKLDLNMESDILSPISPLDIKQSKDEIFTQLKPHVDTPITISPGPIVDSSHSRQRSTAQHTNPFTTQQIKPVEEEISEIPSYDADISSEFVTSDRTVSPTSERIQLDYVERAESAV
ncbi:hypothetical protein HDV02_001107 [Globomyces sp. JEL0801]|nr:hypothetical protein HDV02_001107 [Globomyces sp. JEL0801]